MRTTNEQGAAGVPRVAGKFVSGNYGAVMLSQLNHSRQIIRIDLTNAV